MMKVCNACKLEKPLSAYTKGKGTCMLCRRNIWNDKYKIAKDIITVAAKEERDHFYKEIVEPRQQAFITPEQYEIMKTNPHYRIDLSKDLPYPFNRWLDEPISAEDHARGLVKDRVLVEYNDGTKHTLGLKFLLY